MRRTAIMGLVGLAACWGSALTVRGDEGPVTVERLLDRMADPRRLAEPPAPGERTVQFSSYDRATKLDGGAIVHPFANGDRGHYLRVEGDGPAREFVLAEAEGPGYVSRIWSANPAGELRVYIDGAERPALAADFARITNGEIAPFSAPFGHDASRGRNLYFPLPFARSIKITTTEGDQYYQVAVTTLPPDTAVESYSPAVLRRAAPKIEQARRALLAPFEERPAGEVRSRVERIEPGRDRVLIDESQGPGAIVRLSMKVEAPDVAAALARSLLTIAFDGPGTPQVAVPLGDFFGSGPGINPFRTAISKVEADGTMTARWYMPFRRGVRLGVANGTDAPMTVRCEAILDDRPPSPSALTFHARWRQEDGIRTVAGNGTRDWPALRVSGAPGRFVGLVLDVFNPTGAWWGEGDEKVFVDREAFPSTFGTGTEDYFGYAWCDPHPYMNPFHAQTRCDGPANRGNTSNVRYQILDAIPWHEAIAFDLEIWHWKAVTIQYATLAYFYTTATAAIEPGVPDLRDRVLHEAGEGIAREPGAIEGEALRVVSAACGRAQVQDMLGFGEAWSDGRQLWWVGRAAGGTVALALPVQDAGTYAITAAFTRAPDYGTATLTLDGQSLGDAPVALYAPRVEHTGPIALGRVRLGAGTHELGVVMATKDPRSTSFLFGLDWIKLERVPAD